MNEKKKLTRQAGVVGALTMVSRVLGLVRDTVLANFFGAGWVSDAFFVAFRIPNLLRRLFAEGAFSVAFIPVFSNYVATRTHEETLELYRRVGTLLLAAVVVVTALGIASSYWLIRLFAPGFRGEQLLLTNQLNQIMFPFIALISLVSLLGGVLNAKDRFAAAAFCPTWENIVMVAATLGLVPLFPQYGIQIVAISVVLGGVVQLWQLLPSLHSLGFTFRWRWHPQDESIKTIVRNMIPAIMGGAVYQINILINTNLASFLKNGSVSYLYYSDRVVQLPLGLFAVALGTVILPPLSRAAAKGEMGRMGEILRFGLKAIFLVTVPATAAMIFLGRPIVSTLFQYGRFTAPDTELTAQALFCTALGLSAVSALTIVVRGFYSLGDTKTPFRTSVYALLVNLVVSLLLIGQLKHLALALSPAIAATYNCLHLYFLLRRRLGDFGSREIGRALIRYLILSLGMGLVLLLVWQLIPQQVFIDGRAWQRAYYLGLLVLAGLAAYLGLAYLALSQEFKAWRRPVE